MPINYCDDHDRSTTSTNVTRDHTAALPLSICPTHVSSNERPTKGKVVRPNLYNRPQGCSRLRRGNLVSDSVLRDLVNAASTY